MVRIGWLWVAAFGCARGRPVPTPEPEPEPATAATAPSDGATVHHRFEDAEHWATIFDDPGRDAWQKPVEVVAMLGVATGAAVADIGAGTGYFEPHLAAAVGPAGRVIAIDVEPSMVAHLEARAQRDQTPQVVARLGAFADPGLAPGEVDRILLVDTYHHIDDRVTYFEHLRATLKPGGSLWIVDFDPTVTEGPGPPPAHRLAPAVVTEELGRAGWTPLPTPDDGLPYQYVLGFVPAG